MPKWSKMGRFKFGVVYPNSDCRFIVDPEGKPVIVYWWCRWSRLGNTYEYHVDIVRDGKRIPAIGDHDGGMTRSIVQFLNTGEWKNKYDADRWEPEHLQWLIELREKWFPST